MKQAQEFGLTRTMKLAAIIGSMTPKERRKPDIIKASRKRRIAAGSGTTVQEVNRLLKQFDDMSAMMKRMNKLGQKGLMRGGLGALLPKGMNLPGVQVEQLAVHVLTGHGEVVVALGLLKSQRRRAQVQLHAPRRRLVQAADVLARDASNADAAVLGGVDGVLRGGN